jgi:endonuclease/exonuclease/phosphatase family metal-dependent hydrolase
MRIGTWNLDNRWSDAHKDLLAREGCDVWLLTEVTPKAQHTDATIAGYHAHLSMGRMARGQHWAAVLSRLSSRPLPDPHEASALALIGDDTYCSSILPWAGCTASSSTPWFGTSLEEMARPAIDRLVQVLPKSRTVWGGDWNQNLAGGWQHVGSAGMRQVVESAISLLALKVATAELPFQTGTHQKTIDHIAVPSQWKIESAVRISAVGLSDHDAYIIEVEGG